MQDWLAVTLAATYVAVLFAVAWWGDHRRSGGLFAPGSWRSASVYCLALAVYTTSWSFYGSVGRMAAHGLQFLTIYIGPTLVLLLGRPLLVKVITIAKAHNATSIADFIAARYGKSQVVAALVTIMSLVAVLPYIALQLRAIGTSWDMLASASLAAGPRPAVFWRDSAFAVAIAMALFAIMFGVRHIHASEHHRGLILAIAFESMIKLLAMVGVSLFALFGVLGGPAAMAGRIAADEHLRALLSVHVFDPTWLSNTTIAAIAFVCLPQTFHVAVVENERPEQTRWAAGLFPAYLAVLSLSMLPIGVAGAAVLAGKVNPDAYVIALPIAAGAAPIALLAFVGGLSAATGMVIMASVSLSTMLCNDVIMPVLLRTRAGAESLAAWDISRVLLAVRRISVLAVLLLAFGMHRLVSARDPLSDIGLLSFVAVAQFGPAFLGGLIWTRASRAGAIAGVTGGLLVWAYTLLVPSIVPLLPAPPVLLRDGPWGLAWLRPTALFGVQGLDPITHATVMSLAVNLALFVSISLFSRQDVVERLQAKAFKNGRADHGAAAGSARTLLRLSDLRALAERFLGRQRSDAVFDVYLDSRAKRADPALSAFELADPEAIQFTERLLAGAVGAASARVVIAAATLEGRNLSPSSARDMLYQASEALRSNYKLLSGALESVPQGICAFDDELRSSAWNARFVELLDLPPNFTRVGLTLKELVAFNRARGEYSAADFARLLVNRDVAIQAWPYVYERQRPDGTVLEICYDRMPDGGFVSTYTDVSERYRTAEALRRANETLEARVRERTEALERAKAAAEEANRGKTRFVAAANHDLLQPLNAARLFLAALDESLGEGKGEAPSPAARLRQLTTNTVSALRSAEQMLEALLDAAALESGAIEARSGSFAINELLDQLRLEFQPLAEERGLELRVLPSSAIVHSDPRLLRRILQNLLANAVRYTPKGRILVGCRRQGLALRIEVLDTGEGIDAARFAEVFEEYRQAPSSRSLRGDAHGQGLGLAIVDRMSRLLGHPVSLRSQPGRGTAFGVTVPLAAEMAVSASCGPVEPGFALAPPPSSLLVLCVEDDERTLRAVDALLSSWGHRAVLASDRAAAIEALGERIPDAVLIDHHLGSGPSGPEVLAALRRAWGQSPPALFTTADRSGAVRAQARAQGCELLAKPVKPAALKRFLAAVALRRGASLHAAAQS